MNNHPKDYVKEYYDQEAEQYIHMYEKGYQQYPADAIRLKIITKRFLETKIKTVLDVGCGACQPMIKFLQEGLECKGCDFSEEMIRIGKKQLEKNGYDPSLISVADLENDQSIINEKFDSVIALGVFPHIENEKIALTNVGKRLNSNGKVFIEFRNELFSAFTFNSYSLNFFLNSLIKIEKFPEKVKAEVSNFFKNNLIFDKPTIKEDNKIDYTEILAKFRNPLTIEKELFDPCGFKVERIHFYHFHALPPYFESKFPEEFKKHSLDMEEPEDWKGYFQASAFVIEASKIDETN